MGLDNGLIIRSPKVNPRNKSIYSCNDYLEICYWRKCYTYREEIYNILNKQICINKFEYPVNIQELKQIQKMLFKYSLPWNFKHFHSCGWEYGNILKWNIQNIININWAIWYLKKYGGEVIFYDSY